MKLIKKNWWGALSRKNKVQEFPLNELSQFQINTHFVWGKLEWATFEGQKTSFRFSTNAAMMEKIEKYMHKLIIKNFQKRQHGVHLHQKKAA